MAMIEPSRPVSCGRIGCRPRSEWRPRRRRCKKRDSCESGSSNRPKSLREWTKSTLALAVATISPLWASA
jgi:hypothetical protein